jgi:hypothetical protein
VSFHLLKILIGLYGNRFKKEVLRSYLDKVWFMAENRKRHMKGTDWLGLLSFGFFLILIGAVWMTTPNLTEKVRSFFDDFHFQNVTGNIVFPAPEHQYDHLEVYTAAMQFCLIFGAFQIVVSLLRFVLHEPLNRKAEALSGTVFWFSAGSFLYMLASKTIGWFGFLAGLIISVGLMIIISSIIKLLR